MEMQKTPLHTVPDSLKSKTLDQLLALWSQVDAMPMTEEMPIVRGWIIDELKNRSYAGWEAWMDNEEYDDDWYDQPHRFFLPAGQLCTVNLALPDGSRRTFHEVTIDEGYRRKRELNASGGTFMPALWLTTLDASSGTFRLDLNTRSVGMILMVGTYTECLNERTRLEKLTIPVILAEHERKLSNQAGRDPRQEGE